MQLSKLREFLDSRHIKYLVISHSLAYTAQGIAALTHLSGKKLAKTVIVKIDGILAMAVVPAPDHVDLDRLRALTGARVVELATEREFKDAFPDCETGAMPPFGNLYDMCVYADAEPGGVRGDYVHRGHASRSGAHELGRHGATGEPDGR